MKYALLLLLSWPLAARSSGPPDPRALESYGFDASIPLPRLRPMPPWLLEKWKDADGMPYEEYTPSPPEAELLAEAFAGLPSPMREVLSQRVIGVYLVKGLKGNGLTDWVLDASSRTFVYMILNPAGLRQTLTELLTERDLTLFRGPAEMKVEAGNLSGIFYSVAHESAHAFDYVERVTPYTEPGLPGAKAVKEWDVWSQYDKPKAGADYPLRAKLRFYGFGAPELDPVQAGELCSQWEESPFASFYGSRSWAEDLAELFVLRHLTQDRKAPLRRLCGAKARSPWDDPQVRARAQRLLKPMYKK